MKRYFIRLICLVLLMLSVKSFAFYVGRTNDDSKEKKITLKTFSRNKYHVSAMPSFRLSNFQLSGYKSVYQYKNAGVYEGQSLLRVQSGNTTFVYPYTYKVKVPLFKTPSRSDIHTNFH